jgi:large subunit ribosomal protein L5
MARLAEQYKEKIVPALQNEFKYSNCMEVPKLEKIIISMGLGRAITDKKIMETALGEVEQLAGQKPVICKAKKSVSNFKLREGMNIGLKVTLRRERMFEFLDRLINLSIPRVRDFRGLSPKAFDGRGNYNMGVTEIAIFPEVNPDKITAPMGLNITMVTTAKNDEEGQQLLKLFGMPFRSEEELVN